MVDVSHEVITEVLEALSEEDLIEVLIKRVSEEDTPALEKDVTERIAHAGSVKDAYEYACVQAEDAMSAILGEIEQLAAKYDPLFSALDALEDRLPGGGTEPEEGEAKKVES